MLPRLPRREGSQREPPPPSLRAVPPLGTGLTSLPADGQGPVPQGDAGSAVSCPEASPLHWSLRPAISGDGCVMLWGGPANQTHFGNAVRACAEPGTPGSLSDEGGGLQMKECNLQAGLPPPGSQEISLKRPLF